MSSDGHLTRLAPLVLRLHFHPSLSLMPTLAMTCNDPHIWPGFSETFGCSCLRSESTLEAQAFWGVIGGTVVGKWVFEELH